MRQGVRGDTDHLAGARRDDGAAEQPAAVVVDAHEAVGLLVDDCAIDLRQRNRDRLPVVGADMRDFRIGVRAPRDDERAGALAAEKQRVLDDDPRQRVGGVRELERRADVPRREDPAVRRAQVIVDDDALRVERDAGGGEIERLDVRRAADGDEKPLERVTRLRRRRRACSRTSPAADETRAIVAPSRSVTPSAASRLRHDGRGVGDPRWAEPAPRDR